MVALLIPCGADFNFSDIYNIGVVYANETQAARMTLYGSFPSSTNGEATLYLQDVGVKGHQLRYTNGTLHLEAAAPFITDSTPNFTVGGRVTAGNLTIASFNGVLKATSGVVSAVSLTTDDIPEGTPKYFSNTLARAAISVAGNTANLAYNSSTGVLSQSAASTSASGYLSSTNWNTFNNKEPAITAGTTLKYFRGDKTFQTLNTSVVPEVTNLYYTTTRFNTDLATKTTSNLAEGSNLYYTNARARLAISTGLGPNLFYDNTTGVLTQIQATNTLNGYLTSVDWSTFNSKEPAITIGSSSQYWRGDKTFQTLNTSAVPEGSNLYYTTTRFNTDLATKTTSNLTEGTNLYYTSTRFNTALAAKTLSDIASPASAYAFGNKNLTGVAFLNATSAVVGAITPAASLLNVIATGQAALTQSVVSPYFQTVSDALGATAGNTRTLASFGFRSTNESVFNIKAFRFTGGSSWTSAGLLFSYDVDATDNPDGTFYSLISGKYGWSTSTPWARYSIESSGTAIGSGLSIRNSGVTTNLTHDSVTNGGKLQVRSGGSSSAIGSGFGTLHLNTEGGDLYLGIAATSKVILPDYVRMSNSYFNTNPAIEINPGIYLFDSGNTRYGTKLHYMADPETGTMGFGSLLFAANQTNNWIGFGRAENAANTDSAYTIFGRFEIDGAFRLSNIGKSAKYTLGIGDSTQDYTPTSGNYKGLGATLLLNAANYSTIGFHDAALRVDYIRVGAGVMTLGYDGGYGAAVVDVPGGLKRPVVIPTTHYTILDTDYYVVMNSSSANTATLPSAVGRAGREWVIVQRGSGTTTVATVSSQLISANTTKALTGQYDKVRVFSDGTNWQVA